VRDHAPSPAHEDDPRVGTDISSPEPARWSRPGMGVPAGLAVPPLTDREE